MPDLVSMELTESERKTILGDCCSDEEEDKGPKFPWGLTIRLENASLEKLKISGLPRVGTELLVVANAMVKSASIEEREGEPPRRDVELQITGMEITGSSEGRDDADLMFGNAGGEK